MQESDSCVFSTKDASLNPSKNRYRDVLPCNYLPLRLFLYLKLKFDRFKIDLFLNKQRFSYTETITRIRTNDVSVSSWRHFQVQMIAVKTDKKFFGWWLAYMKYAKSRKYFVASNAYSTHYIFRLLSLYQQLLLIHNNSFFLSSGDHTRVKLTTKEGGDYINANLIKVREKLEHSFLTDSNFLSAIALGWQVLL